MGQKINPLILRSYFFGENNLIFLKLKYLIFMLFLKKFFFSFFYFNNIFVNSFYFIYTQNIFLFFCELYFFFYPELFFNSMLKQKMLYKKFYKNNMFSRFNLSYTFLNTITLSKLFFFKLIFKQNLFKKYFSLKTETFMYFKKYFLKYVFLFSNLKKTSKFNTNFCFNKKQDKTNFSVFTKSLNLKKTKLKHNFVWVQLKKQYLGALKKSSHERFNMQLTSPKRLKKN